MRDCKDFSYYTFDVGREGYKENKKKLVWNIIDYDYNSKKMQVVNLFEYNWVFLKGGLLEAKKKYSNDYKGFAEHVRSWLQHEYWSRCQYECVISGWPGVGINEEELAKLNNEMNKKKESGIKYPCVDVYDETAQVIDIYTQVMLNWDRFIDYVWNNKKLITKKKLGL